MTTIKNLTNEFVRIAKEKNIPLYYSYNEYGVDRDIIEKHTDEIGQENIPVPTRGYITADGVKTEQDYLDEAMKNNLVFPNIYVAIKKYIEDLQAGVFDTNRTYRCIFFKSNDGIVRELWCIRRSGGELSLLVYEVVPGVVHYAPVEFFCSNAPLSPQTDPETLVHFGTSDEYKKVGTIYQKTSNGELKFIYE